MTQLTAVTLEQCGHKSWKVNTDFTFAAQYSIIPVVLDELKKIVPIMPLCFVRKEESYQLMALTSLQLKTNLYVMPDGRWCESYVPAILRAYPFQLAKLDDEGKYALCVYTDSDENGQMHNGNRFFDEDGKLTQKVSSIMDFLIQTEKNRIATQMAVDALNKAGVICPWSIQTKYNDQITSVEGVYRIDEEKLNALSDENYLKLRESGSLAIAYSQLLSMNQISVFKKHDNIESNTRAEVTSKTNTSFDNKGFSLSSDESTIRFS